MADRLINITVVSELTGLAISTIRNGRGIAATLPQPVKLGRAVRWPLKDVEQWISDRIHGKHKPEIAAANVIQMPLPGSQKRRQVLDAVRAFQQQPPAETGDDCPTDSPADQDRLAS